jgi:hypothetical protein
VFVKLFINGQGRDKDIRIWLRRVNAQSGIGSFFWQKFIKNRENVIESGGSQKTIKLGELIRTLKYFRTEIREDKVLSFVISVWKK